MDSNVNKILQNIVNTATLAADEAKAAVHSAGKAVAGKYDEVKMNIELARLSDEQEDVFSDIGRMLFLMHTGAVKDTVMSDEGEKSPQQVIDALLVSAEQVQQEMDVITDKLTAPFAGDADIVLLADLSSPTPTNSYIGVNFLIEVIAFEFSRTLGVYPQQRLSRLDAYLSELQLY